MKTAYYNGVIYTGTGFAEAFIVEDGVFVCAGDNETIRKQIEKSKRDIEYYTEELEFYNKNVREYAKLAKDDFGKEKEIEEVDEDKLSEAAKAARELLRREKPEEKIEEESRGIQKRLKR